MGEKKDCQCQGSLISLSFSDAGCSVQRKLVWLMSTSFLDQNIVKYDMMYLENISPAIAITAMICHLNRRNNIM